MSVITRALMILLLFWAAACSSLNDEVCLDAATTADMSAPQQDGGVDANYSPIKVEGVWPESGSFFTIPIEIGYYVGKFSVFNNSDIPIQVRNIRMRNTGATHFNTILNYSLLVSDSNRSKIVFIVKSGPIEFGDLSTYFEIAPHSFKIIDVRILSGTFLSGFTWGITLEEISGKVGEVWFRHAAPVTLGTLRKS